MNASLLIKKAAAEGVRVRLENDNKLKACGPAEARAKWLPILREHRSELLAELTGGTLRPSRPPLRQGGEIWRSDDDGAAENSLEAIDAQMNASPSRLTLRNIARDETVIIDLKTGRRWRA